MTKKYSDEISGTDQPPLIINPNCYKSVEEEFNEALKNITFAGMADELNKSLQDLKPVDTVDECFGPFFMWMIGE